MNNTIDEILRLSGIKLTEATSYQDAVKVFAKFGIDATKMSNIELTLRYKQLAKKMHPDRGGNTEDMQDINDAFDILKNHPEEDFAPTATSSDTPSKQDYTDIRYVKKKMAELARESGGGREYTVWGFDGHFFRGCFTVMANETMFAEVGKAMAYWQSNGGNPYKTKAVFVTNPNNHQEIILIWLDGQSVKPTPFEHDSFNMNPGNDQYFQRKLPEMLEKLNHENN